MKIVVDTLAVVVVLLIIAALFYGGVWGLMRLGELYGLLEVQLRTVLLTSAATVIVAAMIVAGGMRGAARLLMGRPLNDRRLGLYPEIISTYVVLLGESRPSTSQVRSVLQAISALEPELILIADASVVEANAKVASLLGSEDLQREALAEALGNLTAAMRKELRHPITHEEWKIDWGRVLCGKDRKGVQPSPVNEASRP